MALPRNPIGFLHRPPYHNAFILIMPKWSMEEKAQGAIEYLLIIGAAIVVVVVVIVALTGTMTAGKQQGTQGNIDYNKQVSDLNKLRKF